MLIVAGCGKSQTETSKPAAIAVKPAEVAAKLVGAAAGVDRTVLHRAD